MASTVAQVWRPYTFPVERPAQSKGSRNNQRRAARQSQVDYVKYMNETLTGDVFAMHNGRSGGTGRRAYTPPPPPPPEDLSELREVQELIHEYAMYHPATRNETERRIAETEARLREVIARRGGERGGVEGKRGGLLAKLRKWIESNYVISLVNNLPTLVASTPELPRGLIEYFYVTMYGREPTPEEEARIRATLLNVKRMYPDQYEKVIKLLSAGLPWSFIAVAVLDRAANRRSNLPPLSKAWAMFLAWQSRDPYYLMSRLVAAGYRVAADELWRLLSRAANGDTNALRLVAEILEKAYGEPPPPDEAVIDILPRSKLEEIADLLMRISARRGARVKIRA